MKHEYRFPFKIYGREKIIEGIVFTRSGTDRQAKINASVIVRSMIPKGLKWTYWIGGNPS